MQEAVGDLFSYVDTHQLVIPVNIGWDSRGYNVMGRGVAKRAASTWPTLPKQLGDYHRRYKEDSQVVGFRVSFPSASIWCFPVKPLAAKPYLSWQQRASLPLVERSARQLAKLVDDYAARTDGVLDDFVALPRVGAGNGGLKWADVFEVLDPILDDRFLLVSRPEDL